MTTYHEVAESVWMDWKLRERYVHYMTARWSDTEAQKCQDGYALQWAHRFRDALEYVKSDHDGQRL